MNAVAVRGGNGDGFAKPERVGFRQSRHGGFFVLAFVDGQNDGLFLFAQPLRVMLVYGS